MINKRKNTKRIIVVLVAAILVFQLGSVGAAASSKTASEAKQKKSQLEKNLKDTQKLIDNLKNKKKDVQSAVKDLDVQMASISESLRQLEAETAIKQKELEQAQADLIQAEAQENTQYESMKVRIRYMYEHSGTSYVEALLETRSFAEFLKEARYMASIMRYDRDMLEEYQAIRQEIKATKETIESNIVSLDEMKSQQESEQQAVQLLIAEKKSQIASLNSDLSDAEDVLEDYESKIADEEATLAAIAAAEAKAKKEQEMKAQNAGSSNANTGSVYSGGTFAWPVPASSRISSGFGNRTSPTAGASSYHKGIDIAASQGVAIVAASAGTVQEAGYSSGNGYYVRLSHGGGVYTVYCHCVSQPIVSKGQKVSKGQTIAYVGSTGISTGPHLHFAVVVNNNDVDPMGYLR